MRRRLKWIALIVVIVLLAAAGAFVVWANTPLAAAPPALNALVSDARVAVTEGDFISFMPQQTPPAAGFIIYPGGRVDARAYAAHARAIAEAGYLVVIVPMPLNLAVFGVDRADAVLAAYPEIRLWAVGGHSLGGAMAARYIQTHSDRVKGLVLWASYPDIDLSAADVQAVSIYGTLDGVAAEASVLGSRDRLPPDTAFVAVQGGNHSGFGAYGLQPGDTPAAVSADDQREQIVLATVELLQRLAQDQAVSGR